jgi:multidrug efflux system membrane fusion protein
MNPSVRIPRPLLPRLLTLLVALLPLLGACSSGSGDAATDGRRGAQPVPVTVAKVEAKDVPTQIRAIGNVEPYSSVTVKSQVKGQIAEVHFQEGQRVAHGDLLFTIDPRPFEAALRQAEANLARDLAEANNAKIEAGRRERLLAQGFVSRDEYDQAQTQAASLEAAARADRAAVENAKLELQYCYIRSLIDGRVGQILVHAGNVVKDNDTTLAVINQIRPAYVSFSVPEQDLPEIHRRAAEQKLAVQAFIGKDNADPIVGDLSFINNTVDTATGTILLKGLFKNEDEALWPGQFVDVALVLGVHRNAVVVPAAAVQTGQQGRYVFVVGSDMVATIKPVVVGTSVGHDIVIEQGLQPNETVVTDGQVRLAPNMKVEIKDAAAPSTPNSAPST